MKKIIIILIVLFSINKINAQTKKSKSHKQTVTNNNNTAGGLLKKNRNVPNSNSGYSRLNVSDDESVSKYMMEKTWSCSDAGQYTLHFTYDYCSQLNTYGLIFWTMDRSSPWNYINVNFEPGYNYAIISGMCPDNGNNITVYLFPDGHCESPTGNYYKLN